MTLRIVPLYLGALVLIYVWLTMRMLLLARRSRTASTNLASEVQRAMRAHGNFADYVPLTVLMLLVLELNHAASWLLHTLAGGLLLARFLHAWQPTRVGPQRWLRLSSVVLTYATLLGGALALILQWPWPG
jgi:uncharacterized membrane protein YecN with MAPEG domain